MFVTGCTSLPKSFPPHIRRPRVPPALLTYVDLVEVEKVLTVRLVETGTITARKMVALQESTDLNLLELAEGHREIKPEMCLGWEGRAMSVVFFSAKLVCP